MKAKVLFTIMGIFTISYALLYPLEYGFIEVIENITNNKKLYAFYSYILLSSDIILPIPNSIIMYLNGYILGFIQGTMLSIISLMTTSILGYYLGYFSSRVVNKTNKEFNLNNKTAVGILLSRSIPIVSETICIVAGYNKIPLKKYLAISLIGYTPPSLIYSYFGSIGMDQNLFIYSFAFSLLIGLFFFILNKRNRILV